VSFKNSFFASSLGLLVLAACSQGAGPARNAEQLVRPLADDVVIMEFKGGKITAGDVKDRVDAQVKQFSDEIIESYKKSAEQILVMKLLEEEAKSKGLSSPQELMAQVAQNLDISPEAVKKFIKDNKLEKGIQDPRTGQMRKVSEDEVKGFLQEQEMQSAQQNFFADLRSKANVSFKLEKPRTKIPATGNEPFTGGKDAKVVIYEFSDFQCPFCARGHEVVKQIRTEYADKVKIVFRHFPLSFHPEAAPSAIASMCAHNQGKFWEMHDLMFENQSALSTESYKKWAKDLSLDMAAFDKCFEGKETQATLDADIKASEQVGVNSTPTFFINGKKISGALPFGQFKAIIDEELAGAR